MHNIFIGLILVYLDFNLNIGNITIGLIPDFVGYLFMWKGVQELMEQSDHFEKLENWLKVMAVCSGILYAFDFFGITVRLGFFAMPLGIAALAASLYILYEITMGVTDLQKKSERMLGAKQLMKDWKILVITNLIAYGASIIPPLMLFGVLAALVASVLYIVHFYQAKKTYEA